MPGAVEALTSLIGERDPCAHPTDELERAQLAAIAERFEERRGQIRVLDRRARDVGVEAVRTFDDLVPLMFAHTNYKSYPESLITSKNWAGLLRWFDSLATATLSDTDVEGVEDIDELIDRLGEAGHRISCSSGTTGKCAFLPQAPGDLDALERQLAAYTSWPDPPIPRDGTHPVFRLGMESGPHRGPMQIPMFEPWGPVFSFPGVRYRVSEVNRMGEMRRAMIDGTALPDDITRFEQEVAERQARGAEAQRTWADTLLDHRREPCLIYGGIAALWRAVEYARSLGVPDGDFHEGTTISTGGGLKGGSIPDDAWETTAKFFGAARWYRFYGMTEMNSNMLACEVGNYHRAAWVALLLLDESGERLVPLAEGETREGRAAYFDLSVEGHWGGVVTGDLITVVNDRCACGRPGPVILPKIVRYSELGRRGDDKLTCGGTIDSYLRGFIEV